MKENKKMKKRFSKINLIKNLKFSLYTVLFLVLLLFLIVFTGPGGKSETLDFSDSATKKAFDNEIEEILKETGIPGVSLALIENDEIVYANFYGYSDISLKSKVNDKTLFESCSLSKMYMIHAVMQLVEDGLLDLEKPVYQFLEHEGLQYDERYKTITAGMLLNHTSGIENWIQFNDPEKLEILGDPGTVWEYSGTGYNYLAKVIEVIIDEPYEDYVNRLVLKPLNIEESTALFSKEEKANVNYARAHSVTGEPIDFSADKLSPASSICTNAEAYAKMLISLFNKDYLSEKSINHLVSELWNNDPDKIEIASLKYYKANGFFISENSGDKKVEFYGSNEGFKSQYTYSLKDKRGFVYLTNSDLGDIFSKRLNDISTNFGFFNLGFYNDVYDFELFSLLDKIYTFKGEDKLFYEVTENARKPNWSSDNVKGKRSILFVVFDSLFITIAFLMILFSLIQIFGIKKFKYSRERITEIFTKIVRVIGLLYLILWLFAVISVSMSDNAPLDIYMPLIYSIIVFTIVTQLFWFKWIRNLPLARILISLFMLFSLVILTGVLLIFPEISIETIKINYSSFSFISKFISDYAIGSLIMITILVILGVVFRKTKTFVPTA